MNRPLIVTVALSAVLLAGCSKALTESSASGVIQKWVDAQEGGIVNTSAGGLMSQMGTEMPNPWAAVGVRRLIKDGYIEEKTSTISYPNFSGEFSGTHLAVTGSVFLDTFTLQASTDRPPRVTGTFKVCFPKTHDTFYGSCVWGSINGTIQKNGTGPSRFSLHGEAEWHPRDDAEMNANPLQFRTDLPGLRDFPFAATLVRGNPDKITGTYGDSPIQLQGRVTGPDIQQEVYTYNWSGKLPKDTFNGQFLRLGHLVVDSCDHLLLVSETVANASCKTHVKLTSGGESIFGNRPTDQVMQAFFGKQPDGTWVGTRVNYSPPQYEMNQ